MSLTTRKSKLLYLQKFMNTTTEQLLYDKFIFEKKLFRKARAKKILDSKILRCHKCPSMNSKSLTEAAPGWGNLNSKIFLVGQSLCTQCMDTMIPFTEHSGFALDAAIRCSSLRRIELFISNVVHCHPPNNRASTKEETRNCVPYLKEEIAIVQPELIVALGSPARDAITQFGLLRRTKAKFLHVKHPASFLHSGSRGTKDWIIKLSLEFDKYV